MTRSDVIKKYFPTEITTACEKLFGTKGIDWSGLTDETADKVAEFLGASSRDEDDDMPIQAVPMNKDAVPDEYKEYYDKKIHDGLKIPKKYRLKISSMDKVLAEQITLNLASIDEKEKEAKDETPSAVSAGDELLQKPSE